MASAAISHNRPPDSSPGRYPLRLRLRVMLQRDRLDCALALGCTPHMRPELELRARQITSRRSRAQLARSFRRTVAEVQRPRTPRYGAAVPLRTAAVRPWSEALLGLADRLDAPDTLSPAAIARVRELLTDGTGPLYCDHPRRSLDQMIWRIADVLQAYPAPDDAARQT